MCWCWCWCWCVTLWGGEFKTHTNSHKHKLTHTHKQQACTHARNLAPLLPATTWHDEEVYGNAPLPSQHALTGAMELWSRALELKKQGNDAFSSKQYVCGGWGEGCTCIVCGVYSTPYTTVCTYKHIQTHPLHNRPSPSPTHPGIPLQHSATQTPSQHAALVSPLALLQCCIATVLLPIMVQGICYRHLLIVGGHRHCGLDI